MLDNSFRQEFLILLATKTLDIAKTALIAPPTAPPITGNILHRATDEPQITMKAKESTAKAVTYQAGASTI